MEGVAGEVEERVVVHSCSLCLLYPSFLQTIYLDQFSLIYVLFLASFLKKSDVDI